MKLLTVIETRLISLLRYLFEMKETNTQGHQFTTRIRNCNTAITRNHFVFNVATACDSMLSGIVESNSLDIFKTRFRTG